MPHPNLFINGEGGTTKGESCRAAEAVRLTAADIGLIFLGVLKAFNSQHESLPLVAILCSCVLWILFLSFIIVVAKDLSVLFSGFIVCLDCCRK